MTHSNENEASFGDLHQFSPVTQQHRQSLFYPIHHTDTTDAKIGRQIYEQFETVVILREQYRVTEPEWKEFLNHLRKGEVTDEDVEGTRDPLSQMPSCRFFQ